MDEVSAAGRRDPETDPAAGMADIRALCELERQRRMRLNRMLVALRRAMLAVAAAIESYVQSEAEEEDAR